MTSQKIDHHHQALYYLYITASSLIKASFKKKPVYYGRHCLGATLYCVWKWWETFEEERWWTDNCPLPCEMEMFTSTVSRTMFPSVWYASQLKTVMEERFPNVRAPLAKTTDVTRLLLLLFIFFFGQRFVA